MLLMAGANPSLVNRHGDSAVHLAVKHNTIENLALMLIKSQHKADINARNFEGMDVKASSTNGFWIITVIAWIFVLKKITTKKENYKSAPSAASYCYSNIVFLITCTGIALQFDSVSKYQNSCRDFKECFQTGTKSTPKFTHIVF